MTSNSADFLLLDNGSQCDWEKWLNIAHLKAPARWIYVRNDQNVGMVRSAQQAYEYALARGYTHLALTHNDVWVFEDGWDLCLRWMFGDPKTIDRSSEFDYFYKTFDYSDDLGGVGFFGSKGCNRDGLRLNTFGNVLDAGHGRRMVRPWEPAVIFDGFFQCYAMDMLQGLTHLNDGLGGFDQRYAWMHIYDYDFSLESIAAGWKNAVLNVPCHHLSGLTANNSAAATSGQDIMERNIKAFHDKWDSRLGVTVNDADWSYTWNQ